MIPENTTEITEWDMLKTGWSAREIALEYLKDEDPDAKDPEHIYYYTTYSDVFHTTPRCPHLEGSDNVHATHLRSNLNGPIKAGANRIVGPSDEHCDLRECSWCEENGGYHPLEHPNEDRHPEADEFQEGLLEEADIAMTDGGSVASSHFDQPLPHEWSSFELAGRVIIVRDVPEATVEAYEADGKTKNPRVIQRADAVLYNGYIVKPVYEPDTRCVELYHDFVGIVERLGVAEWLDEHTLILTSLSPTDLGESVLGDGVSTDGLTHD